MAPAIDGTQPAGVRMFSTRNGWRQMLKSSQQLDEGQAILALWVASAGAESYDNRKPTDVSSSSQ